VLTLSASLLGGSAKLYEHKSDAAKGFWSQFNPWMTVAEAHWQRKARGTKDWQHLGHASEACLPE